MKDKFPEIYKRKIEKLKTNVQNEYYYHADKTEEKEIKEDKNVDEMDLRSKINAIFKRPNYVYKADVNIMYKNGDSINKNIIGFKEDYLITDTGEKIHIEKIKDVN